MSNTRLKFSILFPLLMVLLGGSVAAQWSTSGKTDSALYVCPGVYPNILTFQDGSSIVFGSYHTFIKARKLDPYGRFLWQDPMTVVDNESTLVTQHWGSSIDDGKGGAILSYVDYGRAYTDEGGYHNNDLYLQHLDSNGQALWGSRGILVEDTSTGLKSLAICSDGDGGCLLAWAASSFQYPGAHNEEKMFITRYSSDGARRWVTMFDSVRQQYIFQLPSIQRAGMRIYIEYYRGGPYSTSIIDIDGSVKKTLVYEYPAQDSWKDSILYRVMSQDPMSGNVFAIKINSFGDTLWNRTFYWAETCKGVLPIFSSPIIHDQIGGAFCVTLCGDSILYFNNDGNFKSVYFSNIHSFSRYVFSDGKNGLVSMTDNDSVIRFHCDGTPYYHPHCFLVDPDNAYFNVYMPDHNGGIITAFGMLTGGVYAQHSGRMGQTGIISSVQMSNQDFPIEISLKQNFPNPFNPVTTIQYSLNSTGTIKMTIYDLLGEKIQEMDQGRQTPGTHIIRFDGSDFSSGIYYYQLNIDDKNIMTRKMILLR